jgi:pyruvate dehydrogenase E2 component (dihydrolipoamide acetyltransferase)
MARTVQFQDPGEGIRDAEVIDVSVKAGDEVAEGQTLLVVETDKAEFEVDSPAAGVVDSVHVRVGETIEVGQKLITFRGGGGSKETSAAASEEEPEPDEARSSHEQVEPKREGPRARGPELEGEETEAAEAPGAKPGSEADRSGKMPPVPASPATRRVARELGVDLREVDASGEGGRVLAQDVRAHAARAGRAVDHAGGTRVRAEELPDFSRWGPVDRAPLRSVRRTIARRTARAWDAIPHVTHNDLADITELEALRRRQAKRLEKEGVRLTITALVLKAVAAVLREHPRFNASLDAESEEIVFKRYFHLGVATDTSRGLVVPSIRDVDRRSVVELARELSALADRAREGDLDRDEMQRGTFTVTNVGALGGTHFTPIINHPQVAILGLGRAQLEPRYLGEAEGDGAEDSRVVPRLMLPLCLAFDHRVNDGADAARFTNRLIEILSHPEWFVLAV